jgi:hypothetical protein
MAADANRPWDLETFLDSVILDLDRAVDALSVKKENVRMTYTVQDLSLSLQVFPTYDGDEVKFVTAKPDEEGASTVKVQLGSIRDTQIREIARRPSEHDDVALDQMDIPHQERRELEKLGIRSSNDLVRTVQESKLDVERLTGSKVDYSKLADVVRRARRSGPGAPRVDDLRLEDGEVPGLSVLLVSGENLAPGDGAPAEYPHARLGRRQVPVRAVEDGSRLYVAVPHDPDQAIHDQSLTVTLDRDAEITMKLHLEREPHDQAEKLHV